RAVCPGASSRPCPQAMDSRYANGACSPPYPPYAGLPPPRGFFCPRPPRCAFPSEPAGLYAPPSPAAAWSCGGAECPGEGSARRGQRGRGCSPPQTPGMPVPQYPYGDSSVGLAGPQPRALEDTWSPPSGYGVQWPAASGHSSLYVSEPHWASSTAPAHAPAWDSQDSVYDRPEPSPSQQGYYCDPEQRPSGTASEPRRARPQPRVQYSAQPQLYDLAARKPGCGSREPGSRPAEQPSTNPAALQPEIQRILHVMGEAEQLEEEVEEFVGKKTDKSYRLLEEMLTKLLLELDSIETGGQDSVRQARKESVHRIQAILEELERKGL
ncbi:BAG4 regulator, partial [Spelaeornis formosus]|nr:BAG4 regulator [Elachura formosa]